MTTKLFRALSVGACISGFVVLAFGCASAPSNPRALGEERANKKQLLVFEDEAPEPYRLNRTIFEISIDPAPVARTRCRLIHFEGGDAADAGATAGGRTKPAGSLARGPVEAVDSAAVEWDPQSRLALTRHVSLFGDAKTLERDVKRVECSSEIAVIGADSVNGRARKLTYQFSPVEDRALPRTRVDGRECNVVGLPLDIDVGDTKDPRAKPAPLPGALCVNVRGTELSALPADDAAFSKNRSLDPLTPIAVELLKVVADVAVERASATAQQLAKEIVLEKGVCQLVYERDGQARVSFRVFDPDAGEQRTTGSDQGIFRETCRTFDTIRLEELASSSKLLARALGRDLLRLGFEIIGSLGLPDDVEPLAATLQRLMDGLITGESIGTERDVQSLLLALGTRPIPTKKLSGDAGAKHSVLDDGPSSRPSGGASVAFAIDTKQAWTNSVQSQKGSRDASVAEGLGAGDGGTSDDGGMPKDGGTPECASPRRPFALNDTDWRCAMGIGLGVVRECLREGPCSAEELARQLERELRSPGNDLCDPLVQKIDLAWPGYRSMLARAVDAFRPPPGTTANQTAKVVANLVLDAVEAYPVDCETQARLGRFIRPTRALVNAVLDRETSDAIVQASTIVTVLIDEYWEESGHQKVPATSDGVKKSLALLNAFAAYASTYSEPKNGGGAESGDAAEAVAKIRHDERKRAMKELIEATTDRRNRYDASIFSFGVGVGGAAGYRYVRGGTTHGFLDHTEFSPQLSLPLGLAWEYLPGRKRVIGFHGQMTFLDIGQYASVSTGTGSLADPTLGSALALGGNVGILLGRPSYSVLVGFQGGYAPAVRLIEDRPLGGAYLGVFAGTYVPFFDFN